MPENPVLVIGGGPAGLEAARGVADLGYHVKLIEKAERLGGMPILADYAALTPNMVNAEEAMGEMVQRIENDELIDIRTSTEVVGSSGSAPELEVALKGPGGEENIQAGSVIVATGFQHFDPGKETQMYGYYEFDDVITLVDTERMLKAGKFVRPSTGEAPKQVCFIQCVGSRDRQIGNPWCSKVCCGIATKEAIEIRQLIPDCRVFIFYIDMRMYGFWFIRGIVTEITKRGDQVVVKGEDTTMGRPVEVPMDVVILSIGMEPSEGTKKMGELFQLPSTHGFIESIGGALNTVVTSVPGIFVAGAAAGPADLEDSVSMGGAAAMKAAAFLRKANLRVA